MSEADFRAFAMGFIAAHKEQDEAPAPISEETSLPLRPTAPTAPSKTLDGDNCKQDLIRWAVAYLKKCAPANEGSKGDGKTFNTAGHLFAARCKHKWGLSQADVLGLMEKHYNPRCSPPWASSDLAEKVSSAFSNGTPRAVKTVDCEDKIVFSGETAAPINGLEGDRQYPTTDVGNCDAFLARYGSDLLYVPLWKAWMVWDGKRWARDTVNKVGQLAVQFVRQDMLAYASNIKEDNRRIAYLKHLLASQASYKIEGMLNVCMKDHCVDAAKFDRNGNLFNCLNGTLDLLDGTVSPHRKGDYLTKMAGVSFDPSATAPTWDKFVNRIFQGDDGENRDNLLNYVQRAVGYSMTAETVAQCLFVLWGNGRNGKTTFIEAILAMMGDYGLVGQQSLLLDDGKGKANGEDEVNLLGVRFASCSETNSGQRFDEAKIKRLVGTGKVRARRLYESSFEFEATHKLWLDCNHKPVVRNNDEGIWRRIKLIPFLQQIPFNERDEGLSEKLRAETSGVLNWALKGLMEWRKDRKLHEPSEVCNAVNGYRFESDYFGQFLSDCIEPNDADTAATDEVYRVFCRWMESNGMKQILSKIAFGKKMGERNYKTKVSTGKRYFMKMTLKTGDAADAAETADAETAAADADERAF
jgi:P4 family phage/plasmid primase-like protien